MFSLPTAIHIYLCTTPVDMRCGFDGLAALVRNTPHMDPLSGSLYLFLFLFSHAGLSYRRV